MNCRGKRERHTHVEADWKGTGDSETKEDSKATDRR